MDDISNTCLPLFRSYLIEVYPELDERVGWMAPYDAICEICREYGIEPPLKSEAIDVSVPRIWREIEEFYGNY